MFSLPIDLMTERNLQLFMRLSGLGEIPIASTMHWQQQNQETVLDYRPPRLSISHLRGGALRDREFDIMLLQRALLSWQPARFGGIPQRLYLLRRGIAISCSPPADSSAEFWLMLHRRQKALLEHLCVP